MAVATVDHRFRHPNHLHLDSIPVVDLRLFSQPELLSISLCSSLSPSNADTQLSTPEIDRSVFNESAGSRKQTFSRLRLASTRRHLHVHRQRHSSPSSKPFLSRPLLLNPEPLDKEGSGFLSLLKSLFNIDDSLTANTDDNGPSDDKDLVRVQTENGNSVLQNVPIGNVSGSSVRKRKRGRPRRDEKDNLLIESENLVIEEYKETAAFDRVNETPNAGNISSFSEGKRRRGRPRREESRSRVIAIEEKKVESKIERVALGSVESILGIEEELKRMTEGLGTEAKLLEFLGGLEGEWASKSQKKRIIDADGFGNVLPKGWKLMLFVKRRAGHFWLACSQYISPNGQRFVSCKEVSSYLLSFGGLKDSSLETLSYIDCGIGLGIKPTSGNLPVTCLSSGHEKQAPLQRTGGPREVQRAKIIKCHKCTMTFNQQDDFICHLLSSHQGLAKISGHGTSTNEEVTIKSGKYECQYCHELFEEKNCYSSHLRIHMKNNMKKVESSVAEQNNIQPFNSPGNNENALVETYTDKYSQECNLLSHDEVDKVNRNEKKLSDKNCDKQNKFRIITNNKGTGTAAADLNVCLGSENVLFTAEKKGISQSSDKTDVLFALNLMEEKKRRMALNTSFLAPNARGNMFRDEKVENRHFAIFTKGMETHWKDKVLRNDPNAGYADTCTRTHNASIDVEQENYTEGCSLFLSGNKQRGNLVDHVKGASFTIDSAQERGSGFGPSSCRKTFTCTVEEHKQDKGSESSVHELYANQKKSNYETSANKVSFFMIEEPKHNVESSLIGNARANLGRFALTGIRQESCSPLFSGNGEKFSGKNNVPGISSVAVNEPKQNRGAFEDLFCQSGSEQTHFANNLNMVYAGTAHDASRLGDFENARNNEIMVGYSNHARPTEESMTGLTWKSDEGNVLLRGLADTSSQLFQSSGYCPTFDLMSHKGESEMFNISGKCSGVSGSDSMEHMEYNFLTTQPSSRSGNSNVSSYDSEMALKFDSSVWLGKETLPLFPKIAGRHQVTALCSLCGNEFYHEAVDIGAQRSSMVMCANCRVRFSRNHDFMWNSTSKSNHPI